MKWYHLLHLPYSENVQQIFPTKIKKYSPFLRDTLWEMQSPSKKYRQNQSIFKKIRIRYYKLELQNLPDFFVLMGGRVRFPSWNESALGLNPVITFMYMHAKFCPVVLSGISKPQVK